MVAVRVFGAKMALDTSTFDWQTRVCNKTAAIKSKSCQLPAAKLSAAEHTQYNTYIWHLLYI